MKFPRLSLLLPLFVCLLALLGPSAAAGERDWKPIDPAHLAMKSPVVDPDADAEAIFWEVRVSHETSGGQPGTQLNHYIRIKVFTERGRESQSRIDLTFAKVFGRETRINDIAARTIKPDGTVVELKKEDIFEREIVKANGLKVKAKTFAMPGVEPGAIIEYRWRESRGDSVAQYERFDFARDIPVQFVKYYVKPSNDFALGMRIQTFQGNPTPFQKEAGGFYSTTMSNVAAFREEPRMPPQYAVRPWMLVFYAEDRKLTPEKFWNEYGRAQYEQHKSSMKVSDEIKRAAVEAVGTATTPEEKLDRIFEYVRAKVRNVGDDASGFTRSQVEKMKDNKTPADTLKRGVGDWHDIDMLFAALATAAGFEARVAKVTDRGDTFFDPSFTDEYFMIYGGTENIAVRVGDGWRFYDPGSSYVPQGMLRWQEEGQDALVTDPKQPAFVRTPFSPAEKSKETRRAKLRLSEDGTLEGEVTIEYTGHLAGDMKETYDDKSPAEREEAVKEKLKARMGAEVSDIQVENVTDPVKPFVYRYKVRVPGYAQRTGKRLFLQPAFFMRGEEPLFPTSQRRHHVYFNYPWSEEDEVEIKLPEGYAPDNAQSPTPFKAGEVSTYTPKLLITKDGRTLIYRRTFSFSGNLIPANAYAQLKSYFDEVHKQDQHTLSLKQAAPTAPAAKESSEQKPPSN